MVLTFGRNLIASISAACCLAAPAFAGESDCNGNGVPDATDIRNGTSVDCQPDGVPDECGTQPDCDNNGTSDGCELEAGTQVDLDWNGVPDSCESEPCPSDTNNDGAVDGSDLATILGFWGTDDPVADINGDGNVDGSDLATILGAWGFCP